MSVSAIANSLFSQFGASPAQSKFQQVKQGFQKLGQDLQSGNLTQAQSDYATLQQNLPGGEQATSANSSTASTATNPLTQAIAKLAQDLQSGNLHAAQSDITAVQQDAQQANPQQGAAHGHHHHRGTSEQDSSQQSAIQTLFSQIGQQLQTGNLSGAQQAYSTLQQEFLQSGFATSGGGSSTSTSGSNGLNISV